MTDELEVLKCGSLDKRDILEKYKSIKFCYGLTSSGMTWHAHLEA